MLSALPFVYVSLHTDILFFRAEVGTIFALSWLITWFGHVLSEFKHTLRLYDFFLASHPLMPIYLAATVRAQTHQTNSIELVVTKVDSHRLCLGLRAALEHTAKDYT